MSYSVRLLICQFLIYFVSVAGYGQETKNVDWQFRATTVSRDEVSVTISGTIEPGWHLYSQNIKEGGPIPTRITFENQNAFLLIGNTSEKGRPVIVHDEIYEMDVTWYTGTVIFSQKIKFLHPLGEIHGKIDYMTCNDYSCLPDQKLFTIKILDPK